MNNDIENLKEGIDINDKVLRDRNLLAKNMSEIILCNISMENKIIIALLEELVEALK